MYGPPICSVGREHSNLSLSHASKTWHKPEIWDTGSDVLWELYSSLGVPSVRVSFQARTHNLNRSLVRDRRKQQSWKKNQVDRASVVY